MTQLQLPEPGSPFDAIRRTDASGEWWSARDLMPLLGYSKWERFEASIDRACIAIANTGEDAGRHASRLREAAATSKNVPDGTRVNYRLSRYGAYLVAMNGDPRKAEVAAAQTYFATKTREAEVRVELDELEAARRYVKAIEEKRAALARAETAEEMVYALTPKAEQADHYRAADSLSAIGEFANDLALWAKENHRVKILHRDVRDFMRELGLLIRGKTIRNNAPTADAQKRGLMRIKHTVIQTNTHGTLGKDSARLAQKGWDYVWDRAVTRIAATGSLAPSTDVERRAS